MARPNDLYGLFDVLQGGIPQAGDRYAYSDSGDVYGASHMERGNEPGTDVNERQAARRARRHAEHEAHRAAREARQLAHREAAKASQAALDARQRTGDSKVYPGYPRNAKKAARQMGLDTLLALLASQGHTDPAAMNMQLTDISRGAEAGQNNLDEYLASMGLSGSGVGLATRSAIGASGTAERSRAIAEENRLAEERKRQDLALITQMILGPRLTRRGQDYMLKAAQAGGGGSNLGAYGNLLGGLGQLIGSGGGSGGGYGGGYGDGSGIAGGTGSSPSYGSEYRDATGWQPGGGGTWA